MKTITLSAEESLIEAAEERARREHTTLDAELKNWLVQYVENQEKIKRYDEVMAALRGKVRVGHKFSREEMNAR